MIFVIFSKQDVINALNKDQHILARRIRNAWYINDYHRIATILHQKLKNFDFGRDEKQRSIDVLKQEYDKLE